MFFIGISMLMAGIGRFAYESYSVGVDEVCAELKEKDYQTHNMFILTDSFLYCKQILKKILKIVNRTRNFGKKRL